MFKLFQSFCITLIFIINSISTKIYISRNSSCYENCIGDTQEPFNNLWAALQNHSSSDEEFILVNNLTHSHYLQSKVLTPSNFLVEYSNITFISGNITIRPLFCDDDEAYQFPYGCLQASDRISLYLKEENLQFQIEKYITLKNIKFNGLENIGFLNPASSTLTTVLQSQISICNGINEYSLDYPSLRCIPSMSTTITNNIYAFGLFTLNSTTSSAVLLFSDVDVADMNLIHVRSFIFLASSGKCELNRFYLENSYFAEGIISEIDVLAHDGVEIAIENLTLLKYNPYKYTSDIEKIKGILLDLASGSNSKFSLMNSKFENFEISGNSSIILAYLCYESLVSNLSLQDINITSTSTSYSSLIYIRNSTIILDTLDITNTNTYDSNLIDSSYCDMSLKNLSWALSSLTSSTKSTYLLRSYYDQALSLNSLQLESSIIDGTILPSYLIGISGTNNVAVDIFSLTNSTFKGQGYGFYISSAIVFELFDFSINSNTFLSYTGRLIHAEESLILDKGIFYNNSIPSGGTFIYLSSPISFRGSNIFITANYFKGTSSSISSGFVAFGANGGEFIWSNTTVKSNTFSFFTQFFAFKNAMALNFTNNFFESNNFVGSTSNTLLISLGQIVNSEFTNNYFSFNTLSDSANLILMGSGSVISMNSTHFIGNKIYSTLLSSKLIEMSSSSQINFFDSSFAYNNASSSISTMNSYILYAPNGCTISSNNLTLKSNNLIEYSHGFNLFKCVGTFISPYFSGNYMGSNLGTAHLISGRTSNLTFSYFNISYNTAANITTIIGGTVNALLYFMHGTIYNNTCDGLGDKVPVVFYATQSAIMYVTNVSFTRNYQIQRGEFVSIKQNGYLYMNDSLINYNHIASPSGSVRFVNCITVSNMTFDNITITDNRVENSGGFSYLVRLDAISPTITMKITATRNFFTNTLSALFYLRITNVILMDSTFTENYFYDSSTVAYIISIGMLCIRCNFYNNIFNSTSGVTSITGSPLTSSFVFQDSNFISNQLFENTMLFNANNPGNTFVGKNLTFKENSLHNSARIFKFSDSCKLNLTNITFSSNRLFNQSSMINTASLAELNFNTLTFENNYLFSSTYILNIADGSLFYGNNFYFTKNTHIEDPQNENSETKYLNYFSASTFAIENVIHSSSPALFLIFTSVGYVKNLLAYNITSLYGTRQFANLFSSTVTLDTISIESDSNLISNSDRWISATSTGLTLQGIKLMSLKAKSGFALNLVMTDLTLSNCEIADTYLLDGSLFNLYQGETLDIKNLSAINSGSLLSTNLVLDILVQNLDLVSDKLAGNAISISNGRTVSLKNCSFYSTVSKGSILSNVISLTEISTSINLVQSSFTNFRTASGALLISITKESCITSIKNLKFINNTAIGSLGGGLSIYESGPSNYSIEDCLFDGNQALIDLNLGGKGGALYLSTSQVGEAPIFNITNSNFINNYAESNGGAIFVYGVPPIISNTNYSNNKILSGENNIASQAIKISMISSNAERILQAGNSFSLSDSNYSISGVGSGVNLNFTFKVLLKDLYGQAAIDDSYSTLAFVITSGSGLQTSISSLKASNGLYSVDGLAITYQPGSTSSFYLETNGITPFKSLSDQNSQDFSTISLEVNFRNCSYGEVLQPDGACMACSSGYATFDFEVNSKVACQKCNVDSTQCLGGSLVGPKEGYWRSSIYSDIFYSCAVPEACVGYDVNSTEPGVGKCQYPYKGNLCSNCEDGYIVDQNECRLCSESNLKYLILFAGVLFNLIILRSSINGSIKEADEFIKSQNESSEDDQEDSGIVTKSLINYMQLSSLIGSIKIEWPSFVEESSTIGDKLAVSSPQLFSFKCLYSKDGINATYMDLLLTSLTPLIFFSAACIFWVVWFKYKKRKIWGNPQFRDDILVTLIVVCFNFQSPVLQANLMMFQCKNLFRNDSPKLYLQSNYDLECWEGSHSSWAKYFSLPMLVFWGVVLPLLLFMRLKKNKNNLNERTVVIRYSFIFKGYKTSKYYWEFIIMIRKYLLIAVSIFGSYGTLGLQIFAATYVILISYMVEVNNHPFSGEVLNHLQISSIRSLAFLCMTALFFYYYSGISVLHLVFLAIWLIFTAEYLVMWLRKYLEGFIQTIKQKINKNEKLKKRLLKMKRLSRILKIEANDSSKNEDLEGTVDRDDSPTKQLNEKTTSQIKIESIGLERFIKTNLITKNESIIVIPEFKNDPDCSTLKKEDEIENYDRDMDMDMDKKDETLNNKDTLIPENDPETLKNNMTIDHDSSQAILLENPMEKNINESISENSSPLNKKTVEFKNMINDNLLVEDL